MAQAELRVQDPLAPEPRQGTEDKILGTKIQSLLLSPQGKATNGETLLDSALEAWDLQVRLTRVHTPLLHSLKQ